MKSGVAVLLRLAEEVAADSRFDCTFVFYEAEEIADEHNGLRNLFAERPDLVAGDFAVLLEPTDLWLEAGCQGSIRLEATFHGRRAHTARPWQGVNAVYRAAPVLARLADYQPDRRWRWTACVSARRCPWSMSGAGWPATSCPTAAPWS